MPKNYIKSNKMEEHMAELWDIYDENRRKGTYINSKKENII